MQRRTAPAANVRTASKATARYAYADSGSGPCGVTKDIVSIFGPNRLILRTAGYAKPATISETGGETAKRAAVGETGGLSPCSAESKMPANSR